MMERMMWDLVIKRGNCQGWMVKWEDRQIRRRKREGGDKEL